MRTVVGIELTAHPGIQVVLCVGADDEGVGLDSSKGQVAYGISVSHPTGAKPISSRVTVLDATSTNRL